MVIVSYPITSTAASECAWIPARAVSAARACVIIAEDRFFLRTLQAIIAHYGWLTMLLDIREGTSFS